jgi:hypothetical protein
MDNHGARRPPPAYRRSHDRRAPPRRASRPGPPHIGCDELDDASRRQAEGRARDGASVLADAGWSCATAALEHRNVAAAIIGAAAEHDAAVVVTGTRGRSWMTAAPLGSTADGHPAPRGAAGAPRPARRLTAQTADAPGPAGGQRERS